MISLGNSYCFTQRLYIYAFFGRNNPINVTKSFKLNYKNMQNVLNFTVKLLNCYKFTMLKIV